MTHAAFGLKLTLPIASRLHLIMSDKLYKSNLEFVLVFLLLLKAFAHLGAFFRVLNWDTVEEKKNSNCIFSYNFSVAKKAAHFFFKFASSLSIFLAFAALKALMTQFRTGAHVCSFNRNWILSWVKIKNWIKIYVQFCDVYSWCNRCVTAAGKLFQLVKLGCTNRIWLMGIKVCAFNHIH